jgi:hypothetical protein
VQPQEFERYEKLFRRGKLLAYLGMGFGFEFTLLSLLHWREYWPHLFHLDAFFKTHPVVAWTMLVFSNLTTMLVYAGGRVLTVLHEEFMKRSAINDAAIVLANITGQTARRPKFSYFFASRNLKEFESKVLRTYQALRENAIKIKHVEQRIRDAEATDRKIEDLKQRFGAALMCATTESEMDRYRQRFNEARSLAEARSVIQELEAKSAQRNASESHQIAKRDRLRKMLAELTVDGICPEAAMLLAESEGVPFVKQAITLLTKAITAQKQTNKHREASPTSVAVERQANDSAVAPQLTLAELFPRGIDGEMGSQILVALAQESPERHSDLRLRIASIYRTALKKSFPARSFDEILAWLLREQIISAKMEKNEQMYSLNQKPSICASKTAADIVRTIMTFEGVMTKSAGE